MAHLFGTDGVRGIANKELTCSLAFKLGQAAVIYLGKTILVGKDTRRSGDMLEAALSAGIMSLGGTVLTAGIIPTPGVAFLVRELACDGGVVISASHNPPEYNGIKFFDSAGYKLNEALEEEIDAFIQTEGIAIEELPQGEALGVILPVDNACDLYIAHAISTLGGEIDLSDIKIALDAAHGAASLTTRHALEALGANVATINDDFDGNDINVECGSTHLDSLRKLVLDENAFIGIAHDGDADRVLFVDELGNEIDGDVVEAVCGIDLKKRGLLHNNTIVSTVMCNLGLIKTMESAGIDVVQTQVGDKYVLAKMREGNFVLGGEQSGHTIFLDHNSTGDGLITALQFLAACVRQDLCVSQAASIITKYPQVMINVTVVDKNAWEDNVSIRKTITSQEELLGSNGRILVRASGTEPLVRVMVEAAMLEQAQECAEKIANAIEQELGV